MSTNITSQNISITLFFDVTRLSRERLRQTGISRYAENLLREMLAHSKKDKATLEVVPIIAHANQLKPEELRAAFEVVKNNFNVLAIDPSAFTNRLNKSLKSGRKAVFFSPYEEFPSWTEHANLSRCLTVHDLFHLERPDVYGYDFENKHIHRLRTSLKPSDLILTVSEYTRSRVIQVFGHPHENVATTHLAPSEAFKVSSYQALLTKHAISSDYFVLFAQMDSRKNLDGSLNAISDAFAQTESETLQCVIVASAFRRERILEYVEGAGIDPERIVMLSNVSDEELAQLYSGAKFLLMATLGEGFGLPVVEAMACGCPVVTSSTTALPEVALDAALFVDPNVTEQITNAILALTNSDTLQAKLGAVAKRNAARFGWNRTFDVSYKLIIAHTRKMRLFFSVDDLEFMRDTLDPEDEIAYDLISTHSPKRGNIIPAAPVYVPWLGELPVDLYYEHETFGVHGVEFVMRRLRADTEFLFSFAIKPISTKSYTLYIFSNKSRNNNKNQAVLHIDLEQMNISLFEMTHRQIILGYELIQGKNGWYFIGIRGNLNFKKETSISTILACRDRGATVTGRNGQPAPSFLFSNLIVGAQEVLESAEELDLHAEQVAELLEKANVANSIEPAQIGTLAKSSMETKPVVKPKSKKAAGSQPSA